MAKITSIEEIIPLMDETLHLARQQENRMGYFLALHRHMMLSIYEGIQHNLFEDTHQLEKLSVNFVNCYFEAMESYQQGKPTFKAWSISFDAAKSNQVTVFQHLMLGATAHMNVDLAVGTARACPGDELASLRCDFDKINDFLVNALGDIEAHLSQVWPGFGRLLHYMARGEDGQGTIASSIRQVRENAWKTAEKLAPLTPAEQQPIIQEVDQKAAEMNCMLWKPKFPLNLIFRGLRLLEKETVPQVIDILTSTPRSSIAAARDLSPVPHTSGIP